jgi:hypothetical protein
MKVTFSLSGATETSGSLVALNEFEAALFKECSFISVFGSSGGFLLESSSAKEAIFQDCILEYGQFVTGFLSTGSSKRGTVIRMERCSISKHFASNGQGFFNGVSGHWYIFDSVFMNVTSGATPTTSAHVGGVMGISPEAGQELIIWCHRCTFENHKTSPAYKSGQMFTTGLSMTVNANSHIWFLDTNLTWELNVDLPSADEATGNKNANSCPMFLFRNFNWATMFNVNADTSLPNKWASIFDFGHSFFHVEKSYIKFVQGSNSVVIFKSYSRIVMIDSFLTGHYRIFDVRDNNVIGYLNFYNCIFEQNWNFIFLAEAQVWHVLFVSCIIRNENSTIVGNKGPFRFDSASSLRLECCCCQFHTSRAKALVEPNNKCAVTIGPGNYFNWAESQVKSTANTVTDGTSYYEVTECVSGCSEHCPKRRIPPFVNLSLEGCEKWSVNPPPDLPIITFEGAELVVKRCKFINYGTNDIDGGCIHAQMFSGDIWFESLEFSGCSGKKGSVYISGVMEKTLTVINCSFSGSSYVECGCLWTGGVMLKVRIKECVFSGCSVSQGTGVISSESGDCYVGNCRFEECTIGSESGTAVGCFLYQSASDGKIEVVDCVFENKMINAVTVSAIFISGDATFTFANSTFHWDTPSQSSYAPIEGKSVGKIAFENITVEFSSTCETNSGPICDLGVVNSLSCTRLLIQSSGSYASRRVAIKCNSAVILTECKFSDVGAGVFIESSGQVSVSECAFSDIYSHCIYASGVAQSYAVIVKHSYFGEDESLGTDAFISVSGATSASFDFCCFQTPNHLSKKAIISLGLVKLVSENCFSHQNVGSAVLALTVEEDGGCGINHYDCHSDCRHVCPTIAFTESETFSLTAEFLSTSLLSFTQSLSGSESIPSSRLLGSTEQLTESENLISSVQYSGSSPASSSDGFTFSSATDSTKPWIVSTQFSVSELPSISDSFSVSDSFIGTSGASSTQSFSGTDVWSVFPTPTASSTATANHYTTGISTEIIQPKSESESVVSLLVPAPYPTLVSGQTPYPTKAPPPTEYPPFTPEKTETPRATEIPEQTLASGQTPFPSGSPPRSRSISPTRSPGATQFVPASQSVSLFVSESTSIKSVSFSTREHSKVKSETELSITHEKTVWKSDITITVGDSVSRSGDSAKSDEEKEPIGLLIVVIILMVILIICFALLMYNEGAYKKDMKRKEAMQEQKSEEQQKAQ